MSNSAVKFWLLHSVLIGAAIFSFAVAVGNFAFTTGSANLISLSGLMIIITIINLIAMVMFTLLNSFARMQKASSY